MKDTPVDFHRLEIFAKVVELKSFTRAAEAVYLSQPTVSEHIRSLEEMLGERLVDRLGREVLPTQAGEILYKYAKKIMRLRQEAVQVLNQYSGSFTGRLRIGASTIPGTYILPRIIGAFKEMHEAIQIEMRIANSRLIAKEVIGGGVEFGVVGARWSEPSLEWEKIFSDELTLVVSLRHHWAAKESVEVGELAGEPFIMREPDSGTRKVMLQILEKHGLHMSDINVVAEMGSTEAVKQSVKADIGVAILSRQALQDDTSCGTLVTLPIKGVVMRRPFYLVRRKNRNLSPICEVFLKHLRAKA